MKYRIAITTYRNGRKTFTPAVKGFFWSNLNWYGEKRTVSYEMETREGALQAIDLHFNGRNEKQTIEFEYINKIA